jgi:hypothetical protein
MYSLFIVEDLKVANFYYFSSQVTLRLTLAKAMTENWELRIRFSLCVLCVGFTL